MREILHGSLALQTKCVRYYMNFDRALALMRSIVEREGRVFDADNKEGEGRIQPPTLPPHQPQSLQRLAWLAEGLA